jgi:hypothetical protein
VERAGYAMKETQTERSTVQTGTRTCCDETGQGDLKETSPLNPEPSVLNPSKDPRFPTLEGMESRNVQPCQPCTTCTHKHLWKLIHDFGKKVFPLFFVQSLPNLVVHGSGEKKRYIFTSTQTTYLEAQFERDLLHRKEGRQNVATVFTRESGEHFDVKKSTRNSLET